MATLESLRKSIDEIDKKSAELFEKRMDVSKKIALIKKQTGQKIENKTREQEVIDNSAKNINNNEYLPYYIDFLKSNIEISKRYQSRLLNGMQIAISGSKGAFAEITANKVFPTAENLCYSDFSSAYKSVEDGFCDLAFLPIENSFGGDVGAVLDLAFLGNLNINGIFEANIVQNLIGTNDSSLNDIKKVISHYQALLQCDDFIKKNGFETEEASNTTTAVQKVLRMQDKHVAAIASEQAAKESGLTILKSHINDSYLNTTRFAVFSKTKKEPNVNDNRFIIMFTVKNEAGALSKAISVIGKYEYNLIDLKSRPTKLQNWNHYFFIEGEGNIYSENGKKMMEELKNSCDNLKIVGSFEREIKV